MIKPLFDAKDDEWVVMVGRYMLNMGALELATRQLIVCMEGRDSAPIFSGELAARIGFVRKRFPREDNVRHKWAMNALDVAEKHARFRNIIAHSPLAISAHADGSYRIQGIMNVTPKNSGTIAELISLEELRGRVDESAIVVRHLLNMQADFPSPNAPFTDGL